MPKKNHQQIKKKLTTRKRLKQKVLLLVFTILVVFIGCIIVVLIQNKTQTSTYQSSFEKGETLYYFNKHGLYEFSKGNNKLLASGDMLSYAQPVLSPDNSKIAYFLGKNTFELWIYDLRNDTNVKLDENLNLYPGYLQSPVWSVDSSKIFITKLQGDTTPQPLYQTRPEYKNNLFEISLVNKKIREISPSTSVYWPSVINANYIGYNVSLPDGDTMGVVNLQENNTNLYALKSTAYFGSIENLKDSFLFVGKTGLTVNTILENTYIYGLEKLTKNESNKTTLFRIPNQVKKSKDFRRVQPVGYCNNTVILGSIVGVPHSESSFGEKYEEIYLFNPTSSSTTEIPSNNVLRESAIICGDSDFIYASAYENPLEASVVFFDQPNSIKTVSFANSLPSNISKGIENNCIYPSFDTVGAVNNSFYAYINIQLGQSFTSDICKDFKDLGGIYYAVSIHEKPAVKVITTNPNDISLQNFILQPAQSQ